MGVEWALVGNSTGGGGVIIGVDNAGGGVGEVESAVVKGPTD